MKIFKNGLIYTANPEQRHATAMAVEHGKIIYVGDEAGLPEQASEVIDLQGKRVIPGIIESHMHPIMFADSVKQVQCSPPKAYSIADITAGITEQVEQAENAHSWIEGWGYDEGKLAEGRAPNRYDLDAVSKEHPVVLHRSCGHIVTANSRALALAGITKDTEDPAGGKIDRDENGEPTGTLRESARVLVEKVMPELTLERGSDLLVELDHTLHQYGITGITEMMALREPIDYYSIFKEAVRKGFSQRTAIYYLWSEIENEEFITKENSNPEDQVFVAGIKAFTDGSVSGQTAWVDTPFLGDDSNYGISTISIDTLQQAAKKAKECGVQMAVHAMGEQAIHQVIEAYEQEENWMQDAPTFRIEHVAMPREEDIQKAAEKQIAFNTQPIFLYAEIETYLNNLGEERTKKTYPVEKFLEASVLTALSSDAPATAWADPVNPFVGIQAAVTRTSYDGTDHGQQSRISVETAIDGYTRAAQKCANIPLVGQLKEGYHADFVVLEQDLFTVSPEKISETTVKETYVAGQCVYQK